MNEIKKVKENDIVFYQDDIKNVTINVIYNDEDFSFYIDRQKLKEDTCND